MEAALSTVSELLFFSQKTIDKGKIPVYTVSVIDFVSFLQAFAGVRGQVPP